MFFQLDTKDKTLLAAADQQLFSLDFADSTSLTLKIEPCFILQSTFFDIRRGSQEIREEWLPIHSATDSN